jgi:hypothetical protein
MEEHLEDVISKHYNKPDNQNGIKVVFVKVIGMPIG